MDPQTLTPPVLRRLSKRWQFLACAKGRSLSRGAVVVQALARGADPAIGLGFTATKRVGGAVVRNRAKRRLREAARLMAPLHGLPGHDYVFIARAGTAQRPWPRLLDDMRSALIGLAGGGDEPRPDRSQTSRSKPGARRKPPAPSR